MLEVWLKRNRKKRLESGHPWIYRGEIERLSGDPETGQVVIVKNHQGHDLATGFYHSTSQIAVRVASYDVREKIDERWLKRRIAAAWSYRKRFLSHIDHCRAVYGEADGIPGLIVDKYGAVAVVQVLSAALDMRREWIAPILRDILGVSAVYERSDARVRELEGLAARSGPLYGDCPTEVEIQENGLRMIVDIAEGQKTGHFFDQRENRAALAPIVRWGVQEKPRPDQRYKESDRVADRPEEQGAQGAQGGRLGAEVLDCFSHTGAFTLHALKYGAAKVTTVDVSEHAILQAKHNVERNGFSATRCEFVVANAFDLLRDYEREERTFDVVILDPPAFAKNKAAVEGALRGYKEINLRGMKLVREGGFLVTSSCSFHVGPALWRETIGEAATDARKVLRLIEYRSASKDHPQLLSMPENDYLKFAIFEVRTRS